MASLKSSGSFKISQGAYQALRETYASGRVSEEETSAMIREAHQHMGELLCPHSAVGVHVAEQHLGSTPMITLATAHPAKFPAAVEAASGIHPPLPPRMADLYDREETITHVKGDLAAIQAIIRDRISA
jgi:threonine synthase